MVEAGFRAFSDKILMREEDESLVRSVIEAALAAGQSIVDEDDDYYCPKCGGGADACRSTGCPGDEPAAPKGQQEAGAKPVECATEGCGSLASTNFVRGEIGSYYCPSCYLKVQAIPHNLYTRPAEQAVTDEMVMRALSAYDKDHPHNRTAMRAALEAALAQEERKP
jgi:hypothetical protein